MEDQPLGPEFAYLFVKVMAVRKAILPDRRDMELVARGSKSDLVSAESTMVRSQ